MRATNRSLLAGRRKPRAQAENQEKRAVLDVYVTEIAKVREVVRDIERGSAAERVLAPIRALAGSLERSAPIGASARPGYLVVRVQGAEKKETVPLADVVVRAHVAQKPQEQRTDRMGLALFALPDGARGELRVEVVAPGGKALESKSVTTGAAAVEFVLSRTDDIGASFELGMQTQAAMATASKKLRALEKTAAEALAAAAHDMKGELRSLEAIADRLAKACSEEMT